MAACGGSETTDATSAAVEYEAVPLTEEEQELIELMGEDVNVVADADYINTISEIMYHGTEFNGLVFQVEGVLNVEGESVSLYRNLVNGKEIQTLGLPLRYLTKELQDGIWVKVTGIVAEAEVDGQMMSVLDIVAIEGFAEAGQMDLEWDGNSTHQH